MTIRDDDGDLLGVAADSESQHDLSQRIFPPPLSSDVWVVALRGFPGEQDEIAAVFADRDDAYAYARWWNSKELHRYGRESPVAASVEEIDFYPLHGWRPPQARSRVSGDNSPRR